LRDEGRIPARAAKWPIRTGERTGEATTAKPYVMFI
jgi:hypothetical protein